MNSALKLIYPFRLTIFVILNKLSRLRNTLRLSLSSHSGMDLRLQALRMAPHPGFQCPTLRGSQELLSSSIRLSGVLH